MAIEWMVRKHGLNHVGLLTLTFGVPGSGRGSQETRELREQAKELEFVQKRWHSLLSNVIAKRYEDWVCVLEMHSDGVWHFHVVVSVKMDIRTGTDIDTLTNYKLPYKMRRGVRFRNEALAAEWSELRAVCCKYRFGRAELMPIKKTGEALARYVAGYLAKSWARVPSGRKSRLVRLCRVLSGSITMRFSPNTLGNLIYRTRLKLAASMLHFDGFEDFEDYLGPRWHCYLSDAIASIPMPFRFAKGEFESGIAGIRLREFAVDPYPFLDERTKSKMDMAHSDLIRKFQDIALDESAQSRWKESRLGELNNVGERSSTEPALQDDLFESRKDF